MVLSDAKFETTIMWYNILIPITLLFVLRIKVRKIGLDFNYYFKLDEMGVNGIILFNSIQL